VIDGSIRRAGGRVRISAHLVEASSRTTLWSDRNARGLEDLFALQHEISENMAGALDRAFSRFSTPTVDPDVFDLYLRASPKSHAPDELRTHIGVLESATQRATVIVGVQAGHCGHGGRLKLVYLFGLRVEVGTAENQALFERGIGYRNRDNDKVTALQLQLSLVLADVRCNTRTSVRPVILRPNRARKKDTENRECKQLHRK
jgi:hypothetical protein